MEEIKFSKKGQKLLDMYTQMAKEGYERKDGVAITDVFSDFELKAYRATIRDVLTEYSISSVLDYGCGGSDWEQANFDESGKSAKEYFSLKDVYCYEPARNLDERRAVDCVVSFDVLEHIHVLDVPAILRDMFRCTQKLLILNIACYPAAALLPNGENAHVTIRDPSWWNGMVDAISIEYPHVFVYLICSAEWRKSSAVPIWNADMWEDPS